MTPQSVGREANGVRGAAVERVFGAVRGSYSEKVGRRPVIGVGSPHAAVRVVPAAEGEGAYSDSSPSAPSILAAYGS